MNFNTTTTHYKAMVAASQYAVGHGAVLFKAVYVKTKNMVEISMVFKDGHVEHKRLSLEDYKLMPATLEYFVIS